MPRAAAGARRAADRAPLRLPPRRAVARPRGRSSAAVEWAAERRPDLVVRDRRPALAPAAASRGCAAARAARRAVRRARQPRLSPEPRSVLAARAPSPTSRRRGCCCDESSRSSCAAAASRSPASTRATLAAPASRSGFADSDADLRILLCHFPRALDVRAGRVRPVLAGHMHGGQIVVPYGGGKLRLAHPRGATWHGVYRRGGTRHARLAGPRHDVRPVPLRGAARGDGARPASENRRRWTERR